MPGPENKVSIQLPPGMSEAQFMKAFETFQNARITATIRDKAVRASIKELIENHRPEYENLVAKNTPR